MDFTSLLLDVHYGNYKYEDSSNAEMEILGLFFSSDIGCDGRTFFKEWALVDEEYAACSGNCTDLEKDGNIITFTFHYSLELIPSQLKVTTQQFVQLFDDWQDKVVKLRPKEVIIKHESGEFFIETKS